MRAYVAVCLVFVVACKGGKDDSFGNPVAEWSPATLDFGVVPTAELAELTFEIDNSGSGELDIYTVILADGDPDVFSVNWDRSTPVTAGAAVVTVGFSPDEADIIFGGRVQVRTSDPEAASFFVVLRGEGAPSVADNDGDGFTVAQGDCDDDDPDRNPGEAERCNGQDDDCDENVPANEADDDGDGVRVCEDDCDDTNSDVYPGAPEICDGLDDDCDGINQDDVDGDGDGVTPCEDDCDDTDPNVFPGGTEVCGDNADNDCDGTTDNIDVDADGHDLCGRFPDCDDSNPAAFPRVVSDAGSAGATGSSGDPLASISEALSTLDATCRTVFVQSGLYQEQGLIWPAGDVSIVGSGAVRDEVVVDAGSNGRILDVTGGSVSISSMVLTLGAGGDGGAIRVVGASLQVNDVGFVANAASGSGAAIFADGSTVAVTGGCDFEGNIAGGGGGAVAVINGGTLQDQGGSTYLDNEAGVGESGGAVLIDGGTGLMANGLFLSNTAGNGGAVALIGGGGHLLQRSDLWSNSALLSGGALYVSGTASAQLRNNRLQDNAAQAGGGAHLSGTAFFTNNTLAGNGSTGEGAAIWIGSDTARVVSNLAHFHDGPSGIFGDLAVLVPDVTHNTVFATSSSVDFAGVVVLGVDDNLSENPGFVDYSDDADPANDDLGLGGGSPAIDTGPPDPTYNDPDGSRNDRGATGGPGAP